MLKLLSCFLMLSSAYAGSALDIVQEKALNLKEMRKVEQDPQGFGSQKAICHGINRLLDGTNSKISETIHANSDERIKTLGVLLQNIIVSGKRKLRTFKKSKHDHKNAHRAALSLMEWGMYSIYKNPMLGVDRQDFMDNMLNRQNKIEKHLGSETKSYVLKYLNESTLEILFPQGYFHHAASYVLGFKDYENKAEDVIAALALEGGTPLTRPEFNLQDDLKEVAFLRQEISNGVLQINIRSVTKNDSVQEESMGHILDQRQNTEIGRVFYAEETLGKPKRYLPLEPLYPEKVMGLLMQNYALDDFLEFNFETTVSKTYYGEEKRVIIPIKLSPSNKGRTLRQILPDLFDLGINTTDPFDALCGIESPTDNIITTIQNLRILSNNQVDKIQNLQDLEPKNVERLVKTLNIKRQFGIEKIQRDDLDLFEYDPRDNRSILTSFEKYVNDFKARKKQAAKNQIIQDFKDKKTGPFTLDYSFEDLFEKNVHILKNPLYRDFNFLTTVSKKVANGQTLTQQETDFISYFPTRIVSKRVNDLKLKDYFLVLNVAVKRMPDLLSPDQNASEFWNDKDARHEKLWTQDNLRTNFLTDLELGRETFSSNPLLETEKNVFNLVGIHGFDPKTVGLEAYIDRKIFDNYNFYPYDPLSEEDRDKIIDSFPLFKEKPYLLNKDRNFKYSYFNF